MSKKTFTAHIGDFIAGKGFYIVLFLCLAAIGISGYYLFSSLGSDEEDTAAGTTAQAVVTPSHSSPPSLSVSVPAVNPAPASSPVSTPAPSATPTPSSVPVPGSSAAPAAAVFVWPVKGEILHDFSLEVLAYDETMGDWRTHSGIDIAAGVGDQVLSLSSGTVTRVYADDLMGTTVVIEHEDGLCSSYSNLASVPTVSVGDVVSAGDIIGSVGQTALAENTRASHLHLEVIQDGIKTDPTQFLP